MIEAMEGQRRELDEWISTSTTTTTSHVDDDDDDENGGRVRTNAMAGRASSRDIERGATTTTTNNVATATATSSATNTMTSTSLSSSYATTSSGIWESFVVVDAERTGGGGPPPPRRQSSSSFTSRHHHRHHRPHRDDRTLYDPPRLLVGVPMPVVHMRTNSDFPGRDLPSSMWNTMADHPGVFDDAMYSECDVLDSATVLVPWNDDDDDDDDDGVDDYDDGGVGDDDGGGGGGGERDGKQPRRRRRRGPIAVIVDGDRYRVREVRRGAVMPRRPESSSSSYSSERPSERAYWLRSELRGAIYGHVRWGTVLRRLDPPLRIVVDDDDDYDYDGDAGGRFGRRREATTIDATWMSTSDHVAIKEIRWDLVTANGPTLAEDPIKEVAAMQYLQAFVRDERSLRRRRRGEDRRDDDTTTRAMAGWASDDIGEAEMEDEDNVHVMMPLDLLTDDANLYSITPYCNGGRLLDRVERKGRFSEPEARHWMRQILKVRGMEWRERRRTTRRCQSRSA